MNIINLTAPTSGNVFVTIIAWLVQITSSIALGVILFTVLLKLVTLPFDFMSRYSMRKNSVKMEQMRPELEKLQKQYAGDKLLYNQKMTALYKKNGYSMWGACLPTILTLIIFIIAINGFTEYSRFATKKYFYDMSTAYNNVIYAGFDIDDDYIKRDKNGELVFDDEKIYGLGTGSFSMGNDAHGNPVNIIVDVQTEYYTVETTNSYLSCKRYYTPGTENVSSEYSVIEENIKSDNPLATKENNYLKVEGKQFSDLPWSGASFIQNIRQQKSADNFRSAQKSFLWVKNIWVTDSPLSHTVSDSESSLDTQDGCGCNASTIKYMSNEEYSELTAKLGQEKSEPNGYFILIVLTILSSLGMQIITSKSQKAQMELQTVDGQGAQTQKMMTWMMPIMMAIFAFFYSAAFSIYIVLSSVISILTTLGINFIADKKFQKETNSSEKIRGRVYIPKQEEKQTKTKEQLKEEEKNKGDFIPESKEKKNVRGRLK